MSFLEIFLIVFILCPVHYVYLYLYLVDESETDEYDVYYTLYGREQEAVTDCTQCLSALTPHTTQIDAECVGNDYKCCLKLALQSVIKWADLINNDMDEYMLKFHVKDPKDMNEMTLFNINITNANLYGWTSSIHQQYDYLKGEWILSPIRYANNKLIWTKTDKYHRNLKLFLYDSNTDSKRWIVGHNLSSDEAYIYAPLPVMHQSMTKMVYPMNIIHNSWLYHNNTLKLWKPLLKFRFSPSSFFKPQIQAISLKNNSIVDVDRNETEIIFTFTHFVDINIYSEMHIILHTKNGEEIWKVIKGNDKQFLQIIDDELILCNLTDFALPYNSTYSLTLRSNLIYSLPKTANNGNDLYENIIYFRTRNENINWNLFAIQYLNLTAKMLEAQKENENDNDLVDLHLIISLLSSVLYVGNEEVDGMNLFNHKINAVGKYLAVKKQLIINQNESLQYFSIQQLQLLKANYYLKLSQMNVLRGYNYLLFGDVSSYKKYTDKALKICIKQYYGSKAGKKYVDELINLHQYNLYYCNFHTYDTYNYLLNVDENHRDQFNIKYFLNTIKLRWIIREYIYKYSDDLALLFGDGSEAEIIVNNLDNTQQFEASPPPRFDVLFGLRNLNIIRQQFARFGVVQLKNLLNLIECKWLRNHYKNQKHFRATNDRISYIYLQDFGEIMSYFVGRNVKKSYSMFIDFNNTNFYIHNIAQTLREDNTYSILLTINQENEIAFPFPIYFNKQMVPAQKKNFHPTDYSENYEILNNVGDAIIFKGTQHIHFAPHTKSIEAHNYWAILFHYVDIDYDFVEYRKRFQTQTNNG